MKNRVPKERIIYNNYDVNSLYEEAKDYLIEEGNENPTESEIWDEYYLQIQITWDDEKERLTEFFNNIDNIAFFGEVGRWDEIYKAGKIGSDFWKLFSEATRDCDYWKIWDENGHMYLTCSHHDGSCHFEIKEVTDKGREYLDNWEDNWNDKRSEAYVHNKIYERYSRTPRFAEKIYGCKRFEYEPVSKEVLIKQLANQAKSFYC